MKSEEQFYFVNWLKNDHMKKFVVILVMAFVSISIVPQYVYSQEIAKEGIWYDVMRVFPTPTLQRDTLEDAITLADINRYYKPIWIKEFISIEVSSINGGVFKIASGKNDILTKEQKHNMETADPGSTISVVVNYIPENTLKTNEAKVFDFYFSVDAENEACHKVGKEELNEYMNETAITKISEDLFEGNYNLASVKFAIDEEGRIVDAHVFNSSDDKKVDELLLDAVCNMPVWKPAHYTNGKRTKQEFVLAVGNKESCNMNLLYVK